MIFNIIRLPLPHKKIMNLGTILRIHSFEIK